MYKKLLVLISTLVYSVQGATIENGISGEPEVECSAGSILVQFSTKADFEGHVYVKGQYDSKGCRSDATLTRSASLSIPFDNCDARRQRSSNPKGLFVSVTVVITFHPMFITMVDRAYNVKCFYMEADKTVSAQLGVSMNGEQHQNIVIMLGGNKNDLEQLTGNLRNVTPFDINMLSTESITRNIPMPTCTYQVLAGDANGAPVSFSTVGAPVYHKWNCGGDEPASKAFCMTVHSCSVDNGQGKQVLLLDENGCALDKYLLNNLDYTDDLTGGQTSMVFKFPDQSNLFYQCQIRLTIKEGDKCNRSSDNCREPNRGKRAAGQQLQLLSSRNSTPKLSEDEEDENVDVFSQSMTVFDIDDPISAKRDQQEVRRLNDRASATYVRHDTRRTGVVLPPSSALCLSPATFGLLIAVLVTVLLTSLITVAVLCFRSGRTDKIHYVSS